MRRNLPSERPITVDSPTIRFQDFIVCYSELMQSNTEFRQLLADKLLDLGNYSLTGLFLRPCVGERDSHKYSACCRSRSVLDNLRDGFLYKSMIRE